jgi:uncharacterized protein YbjT (DUF2867 family)
MKIAVTTPTGHVGSTVTDFLLEFGGDITVKVLGRRPDKLQEYVDRGAEIAVGAQDDSDYLVNATRGVDALFWATPPGYGSDDLRAFQNRLGNAAATAIRTNKIHRVVNLSSVGANLASGVGPINGLHDVEVLLDNVATNITHLRPGFFFENLLWQLESIRKWGRISLPISGTKSYPMIATRDIGRVAATRLASSDWTGHFVQELHGPADLTFKEVAQILGEVLGRKIVYIKCDPQEMRDNILSAGMTENAADLMLEMYDAAEHGTLRTAQTRSNVTTTTTTLNEFVREVVLPMIVSPVSPIRET